jgi:arylformamidase
VSAPIFRGYDRPALDREYDNRGKVGDFPAWIERYARTSAETRRDLPVRLDVSHGSHPGEALDVFPAAGPGPAPIHVFVHGGYWQRMDKADFSFVARALQPAGAAVVVINYALIPAVGMDELVRQCRAAVAWVWRNAASFGGDPDRITASGHSAGGHLTAMLMATDWPAFDRVPAGVIRAGLGLSGLYDLEPIRLSYLNDVLHLTPEEAWRNSPVHLRPPRSGRLLLAVGALEGPEYLRQTEDLAGAWRRWGLPVEVKVLDGHHHFSIVAELEQPHSGLARTLQGLAVGAA